MSDRIDKIDQFLLEKRRLGIKETISDREIKLLKTNAPIQKIIGFINFDDLEINVDKNVLIPRYETYELIDNVKKMITKKHKVLDLCCGSGVIGLYLKHYTDCEMVLSDISDSAIKQTEINAFKNGLDVSVIKSDLFKKIHGKFDFIISNPPYIPETTKLPSSVIEHEPKIALYSGKDGNDIIKKIIKHAHKHLNKGGYLFLEISKDNVEFVEKHNFKILDDINKKPRFAFKKF